MTILFHESVARSQMLLRNAWITVTPIDIEQFYLCQLYTRWIACGATAERSTRDREVPGSKLACAIWIFPLARKLVGIARWTSTVCP